MCSSCVQGSFFLILCPLESAFSEALQVWNLCVLPCKVDGRLPPRSWLAPRLGNRLDWITTTPGIFAPRTLFSQFISLQHFTVQSHTTSACTDKWQVKVARIGSKNKRFICHYLPKLSLHAFSTWWANRHMLTLTENLPFSPSNSCWLLWARSLGSFAELIQLSNPAESYSPFGGKIFTVYFWGVPPNLVTLTSITWQKRPVHTIAIRRLVDQPLPVGTINHHTDLVPPCLTLLSLGSL